MTQQIDNPPSKMNQLVSKPPSLLNPVEDPVPAQVAAQKVMHDLQPPAAIIPQETVRNIALAITRVAAEVGIIEKTGHNRFHNYKFAQMQDILQKLSPLMAKHGLAVLQSEIGRSMFDSDRVIAVQYGFTLIHTSGEIWPHALVSSGMSRCRDSKGGFDDKSLNKCHTSARKYYLLALFQIATGEEDDAELDADRIPTRPVARPAPPPHDKTTGELMDDAIPEWFNDAVVPPQVPPAADKAGASSMGKDAGAPAEISGGGSGGASNTTGFKEAEQYQIRWLGELRRAVPDDWPRLAKKWNEEKNQRNRIVWPSLETRDLLGTEVAKAIAFLKDGGGL